MIFSQDNSWYLDIICARGVGSLLIKQIQQLATETPEVRYVSLSALPNVIGYYKRFGFVNTPSYETCGTEHMKKEMNKYNLRDEAETSAFLKYLVGIKFIRNKNCTTVDCANQHGYPMTWCVPHKRGGR